MVCKGFMLGTLVNADRNKLTRVGVMLHILTRNINDIYKVSSIKVMKRKKY